jgi:YHS domain-containing protein
MKTNPITRIGFILTLAGILITATALPAGDAKGEKPKPYPLKTCLVSDEKLGEMGDPYVFVHKGQEIKFCCKGCLKDFNKDPEKFLKKLQEKAKSGK